MKDEYIAKKRSQDLETLAHAATRHIGSLPSLIFHSIFFVGIFFLSFLGFTVDKILLILTTLVSLEAIYLSIFIQMTVNRQSHQLAEVSEDVEDISEDVEEISKDIDDIQEDVEEISKDIDDIQEDVEEGNEVEGEKPKGTQEHIEYVHKIERIEGMLENLVKEIQDLKTKNDA